ncbi:MAG: ribokinase [Xanthomonadaceae bacterium]|nr:ribokinase [Xanthomonadaceae bacterium]
MAGRVLVVGSFNQDHVWTCAALPIGGQTVSGSYATGPGGKGFNQAIAARRAGAETVFVAALGTDPPADLACELAQRDGLELRAERVAAPTGCAAVVVDAEGRNQIVVAPGANALLTTAFIAAQDDALRHAAVLLTQLEIDRGAVRAALAAARARGVRTILNPAPADANLDCSLLGLADIVTPNETEFCALLSATGGPALRPEALIEIDDAELHALCRSVSAAIVVITLGAAGCFVSLQSVDADGRQYFRVAGLPADAIDTTGAGDAFNGALAAALAGPLADDFGQAVAFANRYAARSTEKAGAALAMPFLTPQPS